MLNILIPFLLTATLGDYAKPFNENKKFQNYASHIADTVITPSHFKKLGEARGDLDKDQKEELVIVFDTGKPTDMGTQREVCIYKMKDGEWRLWHKANGIVLPSEHGGTKGDPFQGIEIKRRSIVINHYGGSRQLWAYNHIYRFQENNWYLIGASISYFANCEYFQNFDYNLSTGKINIEITTEKCNEKDDLISSNVKKTSVNTMQKAVLMDNFLPGITKVNLPGIKREFYY
jgi:hypothetical protein